MNTRLILSILLIVCQACGQVRSQQKEQAISSETNFTSTTQKFNNSGKTIKDRFHPPEDYVRKSADTNSFANYLQNLPLKPVGSSVSYYNGKIKSNNNVYDAVIDLPIGKRDLH